MLTKISFGQHPWGKMVLNELILILPRYFRRGDYDLRGFRNERFVGNKSFIKVAMYAGI
jgi:hypothetical protein